MVKQLLRRSKSIFHTGRKDIFLWLVFLLSGYSLIGQNVQSDKVLVSDLPLHYKFSSPLQHALKTISEDGTINVEVLTNGISKMTALCNLSGIQIYSMYESGQHDYLILSVTKKQLLSLAKEKEFIAAEYIRKPLTELKQEGCDFTLNEITLLHHDDAGLNGNGLSLSIKENLFDTTDVDFHNRYVTSSLASKSISLHATNMASISGGGGNSDPTALGVAWDVTLNTSSFDRLLPDPDDYFKAYDIHAQNHSYGTGIENYYGTETLAYDESCNRLKSIVHIFSSGNSGNQSPDTGSYHGLKGFANITGQFKQSKNTISVGATDSFGHVMLLSSRGPAYDGRIKPEVVAYGHGGTSGAAALVSGLTILLQQEFQKSHGGVFPPSTLIKAILVNTSLDVERPGPDFESGFGSIRAYEAEHAIKESQFIIDQVQDGEINADPILIPEDCFMLHITLAWNDPAASIDAPNALIKDLDLECINLTTGKIWYPWILSTYPSPDSLILPARRGIDTINNIEQITISFPEAGPYEIHVRGNKSGSEDQEYALTWLIELNNSFQWVYPTSTDYLLPGKTNIIRWHATGQVPGDVQYKYINEPDWTFIAQHVDPFAGSVSWDTPLSPGIAQLRWINADTSFVSDSFIIAEPLKPKVGFVCKDSLLFYWEDPNMADSFEISRLGQRHLEHYAFTQDTFFIQKNLNEGSLYYSVAPFFKNLKGQDSYGFNYQTQGAGCYVNAFYLRYVLDGKAFLAAELGSLHNVSSVTLEKRIGNTYFSLYSIAPVDLMILFTSDALKQGVNIFRITVSFTDGTSTQSEILVVDFLADHKILVFPNPARTSDDIQVLSRSNETFNLKIMDDLGRKIITLDETENPQTISLTNFIAGHYIAVVRYENGDMAAEGFIVMP